MTIFSFLAPGTFTIRDNGIADDGIASIFKDGVFVQNFAIPADELVFRASVPGITIVFDLPESLGAADLRMDPAPGSGQFPDGIIVRHVRTAGDVTLISAGFIREGGSDAGVDIFGGSIVLSAATGVGTTSNAIETQTGALEVETTSGGINLANLGALVVGGLTDEIEGLRVFNSGDIRLVNLGSITLADETAADSVRGGSASGDVVLTANGFNSDINTSVDQSSILAQGGDIVLTAGRDVAFGMAGTNFNNDVRADGDIVITVGRDFLLSGFADFFANGISGLTGGSVVINAGRDISLLAVNGTSAGLRSAGSGGGDVILTTGPDGTFTHQAAGSNGISSFSGDVVVNADHMVISATSGITAFGQTVLRSVTPGREILLGSLTDQAAGALELSDAELDRIFGDNLLLGGADEGRVFVGAPIAPANVDNLTLQTGTDIRIGSALTVGGTLTLQAGDNVISTGSLNAASLEILVDSPDTDEGFGGSADVIGNVTADPVTITGNADADFLRGSNADDTLDGGPGIDETSGGPGDDLHIVDHPLDVVTEFAGEGIDEVQSPVTYAIPFEVETLRLTGSADINGTGNNLANLIFGNAGANQLDGGGGADTMRGGLGNDIYIVDDLGDVVQDSGAGAGGVDEVRSSVSFTLGSHLENLVLTGTAAIDGTGNGLANILTGNSGANLLDGKGGADVMNGAGGNDTYVVNVAGDTIVDSSGIDTVRSVIALTLQTGLEHLVLLGSAGLAGTGNAAANVINGNSGANTLEGLGGNDTLNGLGGNDTLNGGDGNDTIDGGSGTDTMSGGAGNDLYLIDTAADTLIEAAGGGVDTVGSTVSYALPADFENLFLNGSANINGTGNAAANSLTGNTGNNLLDGLAGADIMNGDLGNDTYVVDNAGDKTIEVSGAGTDTVQSSISHALAAHVENLVLTGAGTINGIGNGLANVITGNSAANVLDGKAGADAMTGGAGDDVYVVDDAGDAVTESGGGGTDRVNSSISYVLGVNVERLFLTGSANIDGTGNSLANIITGNGGNNSLDGGGGADAMAGGSGNDIYVVDNAGDAVTESGGAGIDTVHSSVSFTLGSNVENLVLTGAADIDATGNTLANSLAGNGGDNVLNGGGGADVMIGVQGDDTYFVNHAGDAVIEAAGGGQDTVHSSIAFTLEATIENLTLIGSGSIAGTGNGVANVLNGNGGANILQGLAGDDQILGGGGDDDISGGTGADVLTGGSADDTFRFDTALDAATNVDDIVDFAPADDGILLDRAIFTGIAADGVLAASAFVNGTAAADADDRILYDAATGNVFYDADGVGGTAAVLFATVTAGTALTSADFIGYS